LKEARTRSPDYSEDLKNMRGLSTDKRGHSIEHVSQIFITTTSQDKNQQSTARSGPGNMFTLDVNKVLSKDIDINECKERNTRVLSELKKTSTQTIPNMVPTKAPHSFRIFDRSLNPSPRKDTVKLGTRSPGSSPGSHG